MLYPGLRVIGIYAVSFAFWKGSPLERLAIHVGRPGMFDRFPNSHFVGHMGIVAAVKVWDDAWRTILEQPAISC